jgi:hypothetical protein
MTRILGYLNHLTPLLQKRLGPQTEKLHSEFKASPFVKTPNFYANQFTPINR